MRSYWVLWYSLAVLHCTSNGAASGRFNLGFHCLRGLQEDKLCDIWDGWWPLPVFPTGRSVQYPWASSHCLQEMLSSPPRLRGRRRKRLGQSTGNSTSWASHGPTPASRWARPACLVWQGKLPEHVVRALGGWKKKQKNPTKLKERR